MILTGNSGPPSGVRVYKHDCRACDHDGLPEYDGMCTVHDGLGPCRYYADYLPDCFTDRVLRDLLLM